MSEGGPLAPQLAPNSYNISKMERTTSLETHKMNFNFLLCCLEDMRASILVKNTKKWVFTTFYLVNIKKKFTPPKTIILGDRNFMKQ